MTGLLIGRFPLAVCFTAAGATALAAALAAALGGRSPLPASRRREGATVAAGGEGAGARTGAGEAAVGGR
ncbi:hypothetical protein [Streptomyces sp. NPDC002250]|uniref:hypothetical protein n=1 Tax=Streptomyces sp. NPDC002250 TaxID=3364641 RepID=UPI00368D3E4C